MFIPSPAAPVAVIPREGVESILYKIEMGNGIEYIVIPREGVESDGILQSAAITQNSRDPERGS